MPLRVRHYRQLAQSCRNLANASADPESKAAMLALAEDYDRKADLRERSIAAAAETMKGLTPKRDLPVRL